MASLEQFPPSAAALRRLVVADAAERLAASYEQANRDQLSFTMPPAAAIKAALGMGVAAWPATAAMLEVLHELAAPGCFGHRSARAAKPTDLKKTLEEAVDLVFAVLRGYLAVEFEERECSQRAVNAALYLIAQAPAIRERARWNVFASLKDPAVWDAFVQRGLANREELGHLDFLAEIDKAIHARDRGPYRAFLKKHGFEGAYEHQTRLVKLAYPGWRALALHDVAYALALGGEALNGKVHAEPVPYLPRIVSQHAATLYQTDFHPECEIGDANFVEHPNRGITTGQTGKIGVGCVLYPCTLGGVTDKVKPRHPIVGNFVLIGTDVGVFGQVEVGDETVLGANSEIYGFVKLGKGVRIGSSVVARTVKGLAGRPGRLLIEDGVVIGDETLVINDQPNDLVIPVHSSIPAHSHIVNDGFGRPKIV